MSRPYVWDLDQSGATDGQLVAWSDALDRWVPVTLEDLGVHPTPLFADDGSGPLFNSAGTDYLYPDS